MSEGTFESWGRYPQSEHLRVFDIGSAAEAERVVDAAERSVLAVGLGRSYGDSCLNSGGYLLRTRPLKRILDFDELTGILRCEAGVSVEEVLRFCLPLGWFPYVTPGTKFVTVGGAIANDVHGKNSHLAGTFGNHVRRLEILRSGGERLTCSRDISPEYFRATLGGLGLTGIILWAELQLKRVEGPFIGQEAVKFSNIKEYFALSRGPTRSHEYSVAWVDCLAGGTGLGRGTLLRGNHSSRRETNRRWLLHRENRWKSCPVDLPSFVLSQPTVRVFNYLYYHRLLRQRRYSVVHYDPFFYPLDGIKDWNRMYGKRGFLQWQCVLPERDAEDGLVEILTVIARSGLASFLSVLKDFGDVQPEGLLSFPMPGITLALDFANVGSDLFVLLERLDSKVMECGGRIYPAKDARMSGQMFRAGYPRFEEFCHYVDPKFSSSFLRRVAA